MDLHGSSDAQKADEPAASVAGGQVNYCKLTKSCETCTKLHLPMLRHFDVYFLQHLGQLSHVNVDLWDIKNFFVFLGRLCRATRSLLRCRSASRRKSRRKLGPSSDTTSRRMERLPRRGVSEMNAS